MKKKRYLYRGIFDIEFGEDDFFPDEGKKFEEKPEPIVLEIQPSKKK